MPADQDTLLRKIGSLLYIIGPIQFVVAMGVEQALRPGYSDWNNAISDLGVNGWYFSSAPANTWQYAWIFNTSIVILAVCVFLGLPMVWQVIPRGKGVTLGLFFLALAGLGALIVGFFPENTGAPHLLGAFLAFFFAGLVMVMFSFRFWGHPIWKAYAIPSLLGGLVDLAALVIFLGTGSLPHSGVAQGHWLWERVIVAPVLIWAPLLGIRAWMIRPEELRPASPSSPPPASA